MANDYYDRLSEMNPGEVADGLAMEQEFDAIARGFAKLPTPHREGSGFEGAVKVGAPVDSDDAVNLAALEALNLPMYRKSITSEDWNTLTKAGLYDVVGASGDNKPPVLNLGVLHVYTLNGVCNQIYYPDSNDTGALAKRTCQNIATNSWLPWSVMLPTDALADRVTALEARKFTTLIPATYPSGAPHDTHETVDAALPASLAPNNSYILTNPFGINTRVDVVAEIWWNNRWAECGSASSTTGGLGTKATYVQGVGIVVQTGRVMVATNSPDGLGGHGVSSPNAALSSAPCRVAIRKWEG
ncbi:MAG: hypothetical protein KA754_03580 [Corallincola sp.]|nr:hypothetical protein [Corallincola sp.]